MYGIDYSRTFICDGMCLYFHVHLKDITFENKTKHFLKYNEEIKKGNKNGNENKYSNR